MSASRAEGSLTRLVLATTFLTGCSGLVYEVTWQRFLGNLLGSQSKSTTLVLAVFLGGLALGYLLFGNLARGRSSKDLLRFCGMAELGIGAWALLFPMLYGFLWEHIGVVSPLSPFVFAVDLTLAVILIGPPTVLMGCTLPLLTQGISQSREAAARTHARVYTWNTAGAFAGCLLAGFILLPLYGLPLTEMGIALVNILCGLCLLFLGNRSQLEQAATIEQPAPLPGAHAPGNISGAAGIGIAFLAGFLGLTFQTILIRVVCISLGSSEYTFSMIVSIYILMLALGASTLGAGARDSVSLGALARNQVQLLAGLVLFYCLVPSLPYWFMLLRTTFSETTPAFYAFYASALLCLGILLALPLAATGRAMPLLFAALSPQLSQSGRSVGKIYFWNTAGCVLGALLGGYLLLYFVNMDVVFKLALAAGALSLAWMLWLQRSSRPGRIFAGLTLASAIALCAALPAWNPDFIGIGLFRVKHAFAGMYEGHAEALRQRVSDGHIIARRDDPNTSVSILELPSPFSRSLLVNGKSDGDTYGPDLLTTRLLAHLPMLLGDFTQARAAVVGFGTGITAGALSLYNSVNELQCIEISPAVEQLSFEFSFANHDVTRDPRFHWENADAYRYLASTPGQLDLIVSEPSNPWVGGVERLYTQEFYTRAAQSLSAHGLFSQWFHSYSISRKTLLMVLHTFSSVFPETRIFAAPGGADLIIIGSKSPLVAPRQSVFDDELKANPKALAELKDSGLYTEAALLSLELPLASPSFADGAIHSLDFPKLSFAAGKDYFQIEAGELQQLMDRAERLPLDAEERSRSLLSAWRAQGNALDDETLKQLGQLHCHRALALSPGWRDSSAKCQELLVSLAVRGLIATPEFPPAQLERLRELSGKAALTQGAEGKQGLADADEAVRAFAAYDSDYLPLQPERLLKLAAPCLDGSSADADPCRAHLVEALVARGYPQLARTQLEQLLKAGTALPQREASTLSESVRRAEESLATHEGSKH